MVVGDISSAHFCIFWYCLVLFGIDRNIPINTKKNNFFWLDTESKSKIPINTKNTKNTNQYQKIPKNTIMIGNYITNNQLIHIKIT